MATAAKITVYRVEASYERDGQIVDCSQAEVLGEAYGHVYATREDAEDAVEDLRADLADAELDPTTSYSVSETRVSIAAIKLHADEPDDLTCVTADVRIDGCTYGSVWYCEPRQTASGIDGYDPAGDGWIDSRMIALYGIDTARSIGEEIIASVGR